MNFSGEAGTLRGVRPVLLSSLTAAVAAIGAAAAVAGSPARGASEAPAAPSAVSLYPNIVDTTFTASKSRLALEPPETTTYEEAISTGEIVHIRLSSSFFPGGDATAARQWADFFGSLLHGSEISSLQVYVLTQTEVENICGRNALACYGSDQLFIPAADPDPDLTVESVAAHEYGHHVAEYLNNRPWAAIDWGPKRWASVEQVCANTRAGRFFPGAEDDTNYEVNPGEGWAETYRVLTEQRLGLPQAPWQVVSNDFFPNAASLAAAQADVATPWNGPTTTTLKGSVRKGAAVRTFSVKTPLDGQLRVTLTAAKGERVRLDVLSGSSTPLVRKLGRTISGSATICGQRTLRVRVTRVAGSGAFRVAVTRP